MDFVKVDGKEIAEKIFEEQKKRVGELKKKNIIPHLAVILVGENPASMAYVLLKQKKGEAIGAKVHVHRYETSVTTDELAKKVEELNSDNFVHAILIQRPLPDHIDVEKLEMLTSAEKDVDGFHPNSPFTLPLPLAVVKILQEIYEETTRTKGTKITQTFDSSGPSGSSHTFLGWMKTKNIVVLGKGPTGGGPIIAYLKKLGINPQLVDSKTKKRERLMKNADIIIASVGKENVVRPEDLKKSVILVGVGILRGEDGKLKGDYDPEKVKDIASFYTPTPGGVGPVNVAMLLENVLSATEKQTRN